MKKKGTIVITGGTRGIIEKIQEILRIPCNGVDIVIHANRAEVPTIDYHIYGIIPGIDWEEKNERNKL